MMQSFGRVALAVAVLNIALTAAYPLSDAYELEERDEFGTYYGELEVRNFGDEGRHAHDHHEVQVGREDQHHRRPAEELEPIHRHPAEGALAEPHRSGGRGPHQRHESRDLVHRRHDKHHGKKHHGKKHHGKKHGKHHDKKGRKHHSKKSHKHGHKKHGHKEHKSSHSHYDESYLAAREYDLEELD